MEPLCFLNGEMIPLSEAKVGILDLGMLRGFGIYEGIAAFSGEPFHYADHWQRFERSAKALDLALPFSKTETFDALKKVAAGNVPTGRASIRMVLTGGEALGGLEYVSGRSTFFITAEPTIPLASELYTKGAKLITHEHQRFMPEAKTINYITAVMLQPARKHAGAIEILYMSNGHVLECATSNVFMIKDDIVITPKDGVLFGITRKVVLEIAGNAGYPIEERNVSVEEFLAADETFITSSFKDIVPVATIDAAQIASAPGPVTRDLMKRFAEYAIKS